MDNLLFTEKEYALAFSEIKHQLTDGVRFEDKDTTPLATLLGGQPGAGKSRLTSFILSRIIA